VVLLLLLLLVLRLWCDLLLRHQFPDKENCNALQVPGPSVHTNQHTSGAVAGSR
jgi:hypothetical protein